MADERLRALEREARAGGDRESFDRLVQEQLRAQEGGFFELTRRLEALHAFELPVMREDIWKVGGALLRDVGPPWLAQVEDVPVLLDDYLARVFSTRFTEPVGFQAAAGRPPKMSEPREEDFEDPDDWEDLQEAYYQDLSRPGPWTELSFPGPVPRPFAEEGGSSYGSPEALLLEVMEWSINSKLYRFVRADGSEAVLAYSFEPEGRDAIARMEEAHQERRRELVRLLLDGVSEQARFFYTMHVLDEDSARDRGWDLFMDEVVAVVDAEHVRVAWAGHDRYYG